jgi:hypothetical protein
VFGTGISFVGTPESELKKEVLQIYHPPKV